MSFFDAVAYLFFPRCPAEQARSLRQRAQDVRNNGQGPRAGEVAQWDRWDETRPLHERGRAAFVPEGFVARDTEGVRSIDEAERKVRRGRSGRKRCSSNSKPFGRQTGSRKKAAMPIPETCSARNARSHRKRGGEELSEARSGAPNGSTNTVDVGHWQQSQGRWPFTGVQ